MTRHLRIAALATCRLAAGPAIALAPDTGGGGRDAGSDPHGLTAKHRGAGSYSVMSADGETEILDKLTKAEADHFNSLAADAKRTWVEDTQAAREKEEADREQGGGGPITQTPDTQAGGANARAEVDVDPDGPDGHFKVKNVGDTPGSLMASGQMITLTAGQERPLVLSAVEKAHAEGYGYFALTPIEPEE